VGDLLGAGAVGVKDLHGVELGLLSDTVLGTANGTGDVGTVTMTVSVAAVSIVGEESGTAPKVLGRGSSACMSCR